MTVTDTLQTNKTQNAILKNKLEGICCKSDFYCPFEMLFLPSSAVKMTTFFLNVSILIKTRGFLEKCFGKPLLPALPSPSQAALSEDVNMCPPCTSAAELNYFRFKRARILNQQRLGHCPRHRTFLHDLKSCLNLGGTLKKEPKTANRNNAGEKKSSFLARLLLIKALFGVLAAAACTLPWC